MSRDTPRTAKGRPLARFAREEGGGILVFWGLFLAVAFGFLALSFDIGRVANTQSELQSFADQVALAAAGELDGRPDAITRATAAANGLIRRSQTFGEGNRDLGQGDFAIEFLRSLPASDLQAATDVTTNPARARFVRITVNRRNVRTPFAAVNATLTGRAGANTESAVGAAAVAGVASYACDITPLFFCVPDATWRADANVGQQIELRTGGQGAAWGPGNFGFLDPASLPVDPSGACAGLSGAGLYRCLVGAERAITACVRTDAGVDTLTGQRQGLVRAFNTRFDIFRGPLQSERNNPDYRPAPNTIQGTVPRGNNQCRGNNVDPSDAMALPRDAGILSGSSRFGQGDWAREAYLDHNHGGNWPLGGLPPVNFTRYEVYRAEIEAAQSRAAPDNVPLPGFEETGAAQCHQLGPSSDPNRRTVIAAAIDCANNDMNGRSNVIPLEFVRLFMTEPVLEMGSDDKGAIMVEVVESAGGTGMGAASGIFREVVQLFR